MYREDAEAERHAQIAEHDRNAVEHSFTELLFHILLLYFYSHWDRLLGNMDNGEPKRAPCYPMARQKGFEPPTFRLGVLPSYSYAVSYSITEYHRIQDKQ